MPDCERHVVGDFDLMQLTFLYSHIGMDTSITCKPSHPNLPKGAGRPPRRRLKHVSDPSPLKTGPATVAALKSRTPRATVLFQFEAPAADCVKLVADFTGWEKQPLDLRRTEDGTWQISVELPCGCYSYRFLVDNEWRDDPRGVDYEPNPYGGLNAVLRVI